MQNVETHEARPKLKEFIVEASQALALLDAARLEELALSCRALTRDGVPMDAVRHTVEKEEATGAIQEMAVFARVLDATRANLEVMRRLRELHAGRLEYGPQPAQGWALKGHGNGDN